MGKRTVRTRKGVKARRNPRQRLRNNPRPIVRTFGLWQLLILCSSLLVGVVGAATYYSITMQPRIEVAAPVIKFVSAADTPTGSTVTDPWARFLCKSYTNATLTYEMVLNVSNIDTVSHEFRLRHVDISPPSGDASVSNWTRIKWQVYDAVGTLQATFEYTTTDDTWNITPDTAYMTIPAGTQWYIRLETLSPADATTGLAAELQIAVDVRE